jgi:hypothetical protein
MDFMSEFRPREGTVQVAEALSAQLGQLDQQIKTFNNPAMKQFASHLMAAQLLLHQWTISQTTDLADYAQAIAARMEGEGNLDDEDFATLAAVHEHLEGLQKLFETMKGVLPPDVIVIGERNKELTAALAELLDVAGEGDDEAPLFDDEPPATEPSEEVTP